ncbi:MAG: YggS family pyridoxal phosphate-dependent enzyme [Dehalococcoidia bacterium]
MTAVVSEVRERVAAVRARIEAACARAGRDPGEVTLIAVSKTFGLDAVEAALEAGITDFGENRAQQLVPKAEGAASMGLRPRWHFIGHLQRNKARDVVPHIVALHSVDSPRLVTAISREIMRIGEHGAAADAAGSLRCYLEVNVAGEASKEGVAPDALPALLEAARAADGVEVAGLMTVAPLAASAEAARPVFAALRELARSHGLDGLSMGMTNDFEVAIEEGATMVRVGRAIFGERD